MAQWFYQVMDEILGPVSFDDLNEKIRGGEVDDKALVRQGAGGEWVVASDVDEFYHALVAPRDDPETDDDEPSLNDLEADAALPSEPTPKQGGDVRRSPLALRPCSDCGTMVSKQASVCPKCGRSFHETTVEVRYKGEQPVPVLVFFCLLALAFVVVSPIVVYLLVDHLAGQATTDTVTRMVAAWALTGFHVVTMVVCSLMGAAVGKPRMAYVTGLFMGLFFGPLGVFGASAIDKRPRSKQCLSRISGLPRECPNCHSRLIWKVETSWY